MLEITSAKRLVPAVLALLLTASSGDAQTVRQKLEADAERLPFLLLDGRMNFQWWILYDGEFHETPRKARLLHEQIFKELIEADLPTKELLPLLKHANPKVRALAIVALINKDDGKVLPDIFALTKDDAATFGKPPSDHRARTALDKIPPDPKSMPKLLPQTVGDVATMAVEMYMRQSNARDFEAYWAGRKGRDYCAGWFLVRVERANQMLDETRNRAARLKAVRTDIDRLPAEDRTWTLLGIGASLEGYSVSQKELIAQCKKLGDAKLLKVLAYEKVSDDPDLQPAGTEYARVHRFVLEHAKKVMTKDAAEPILKLADARAKNHEVTPPYAYYLAAVELQPEKAGAITRIAAANLKDAFKTHARREDLYERAHWAEALWTVAGGAETKFLVEWFYTEKTDGAWFSPRSNFVAHVASKRPKENRALVALLVRDPRFNQLDWPVMDQFVRDVNSWTKKPIVTDLELDSLRGPGGMVRAQWSNRKEVVDDLQRRHPKEMAHLVNVLDQWRQKIRDSLPEWNP